MDLEPPWHLWEVDPWDPWELPGEKRAPIYGFPTKGGMSGFPQVEAIGGETSNIFWECSPVHPRNLGV